MKFEERLLTLERDVAAGRITRDQAIHQIVTYNKPQWGKKKKKTKRPLRNK